MIHLTLVFNDQNVVLTRTSAGWVGIVENSEMEQACHLLLNDAQTNAIIGLAMAGEDIWAVMETALTDGNQISP